MKKDFNKNRVLKKFVTAFLAIVLISTMFLVVGCGRDEELVGRWAFEDDPAWVTTFEEDGTGSHTISWGFGTTFQWRTPGSSIRWSYPGHPDMDSPYRISGNALYITMDDGTVFRYIRD